MPKKNVPKGEGIRRDRSSGDGGHSIWGKITKALLGGSRGSSSGGYDQPGGTRRGRYDG